MSAKRADPVSEALDRLHAAPLDSFIALRKELAAARKKAGDDEGARRIAAAPRPTSTAWALDQVAHRSPDVLRAMFDARDAALAAQKKGDADASRDATREYRARVADVLKEAQRALAGAGFAATPAQVRRMGETLQAGSVAGTEARRLLEAGWLAHDEEQEDPFAGLEAGPPRKKREEPAAHAKERHDARADARREAAKREGERKLEEARERVDALEAEAREAREKARRAETAAARAQAEAESARLASDAIEDKLRKAREALRSMRI